MYTKSDQKC